MNSTRNLNIATAVTASTLFIPTCYALYRTSLTAPFSQARVVSMTCTIAVGVLFASSLLARENSKNVSEYFQKFTSISLGTSACIAIPATAMLGALYYPRSAVSIGLIALGLTLISKKISPSSNQRVN